MAWSKPQLHQLADDLLLETAGAKERAIAFFTQESQGLWHNRARALLARRFKQVVLTQVERRRLLDVIKARLAEGRISEQFKDQLRLALFLDQPEILKSALECTGSTRPHVVRYAHWLLRHHHPTPPP